MEEKTQKLQMNHLITFSIVIFSLYILSFENFILFHVLAELFSVLIAYIIFLIIWKTKGFISNRYLIFVGTIYFFIGSFDLLHILTFEGMRVFLELNISSSIQFWIIARYLESISLLIAPILLIQKNDGLADLITRNSRFIKRIFFIYSMVTGYLLISISYLKNFPLCYIEGFGATHFKIISEYLITFMLLCSLVPLYLKKNNLERKVFNLLISFIIFTLLGEIPFLFYNHIDNLPSAIGHFFKLMSFFYLYLAIVEAGFDEPYKRYTREVIREEVLKQEAVFLNNEQELIYGLLGVKNNNEVKKAVTSITQNNEKAYRSLVQSFSGILIQLDKHSLPVLVEGSIEEVTGYNKEDFLTRKVNWDDIIIHENPHVAPKNLKFIDLETRGAEKEYRIRRKDGEIRWVTESIKEISGNKEEFLISIHDITNRKNIEEALERQKNARLKEIHHRIKNNLQVISSLLDLQAEKFHDKNVIQAFKESQNRVISMALIHEELYKSEDTATLDFASYLEKLVTDLLNSYIVKNQINLKMDLEPIYLKMDIAIPLGIVVNEMISNSLKYAFQPGTNGEISLNLYRYDEKYEIIDNHSIDSGIDGNNDNNFQYILVVADNGSGIPEEMDMESTDSLGLQIINVLVDQIDGHLELNRKYGTEFRISFNNK